MVEVKDTGSGVSIPIFVKPRGRQDALCGEHAGRLAISVRAIPENNQANKAVRSLLSDILEIPKRSVVITSGMTSRRKEVHIEGCSREQVETSLLST